MKDREDGRRRGRRGREGVKESAVPLYITVWLFAEGGRVNGRERRGQGDGEEEVRNGRC